MHRIFFVVFALNYAVSYTQVLPLNRSVDWTVAGLNDTSTIGFTYYNVIQEGVIPDGITPVIAIVDSLLQLNQSGGIHLHFPAGSYFFNETLSLPSNCLITGDGATETHFIFDLGGTNHSIQSTGNLVSSDTSSFTNQGDKGSQLIVVNSASSFEPGDWIRIRQQDADLVFSSWAQGSVGQIAKIIAIAGDTLFLNSELRMDYSLNRAPFVIRVFMKRNIGIQCLSLERIDNTAPEQASGIHFTYTENCWISGVSSNKTTFAHIEFEGVSNSKVEKSYFQDAFEYGGGGRGYGVVLHFTTNECLIENNIFKHLRHSILLQAGANGNVVTFNHSLDPYWTNSNPILGANSAGELVLHGNFVFANLFEQNDVQNIVIDNSHGANGPFNTFLRNRASLYGIFFSDGTSPSQNFIGNEIPNTGFPYSAVNYNIQGNDQFAYGNNNKGAVAPAGTTNLVDISYYYSQKPEFVQEYQWGEIGIPSTMNSATIPARDRYESNFIFAGACGNNDFYLSIDAQNKQEIAIYPNPSMGNINIEIQADYLNEMLRIYNVYGQLNHNEILNNLKTTIDLTSLNSGVYFISIKNKSYKLILD